jgi:uncharacterized membrane protein
MKEKTILNKICELFLYFIMYAMIGWIYEIVLEVFIYKWGYSDRGVLTGPYCPVYGFGTLAFLFTIYPIIKNKEMAKKLLYIPIVFLGCMFIATAIELVTSYICEFFMGSWPWQTYLDYKYNFQGRIALSPSIRFGLGGAFFLYILQPLFENITTKMGTKAVNITATIIGTVFLVDVIYSFFIK